MHVIVGLGNPGKKYDQTRHNVGFLVLDYLAKERGASFQKKTSFEAEIAITEEIALLKPQTYMNASGRSLKAFLSKNKVPLENILIIYDDADIPFGDIRQKESGSSAGHNGMKSILEQFPKGTNIKRIRFGIGRPPHPDIPLDAFVLQSWSKDEQALLPELLVKAATLAETSLASRPVL